MGIHGRRVLGIHSRRVMGIRILNHNRKMGLHLIHHKMKIQFHPTMVKSHQKLKYPYLHSTMVRNQ